MRRSGLLLLPLLVAGVAGCLDSGDVHGIDGLAWTVEPSMAPDFTGDGPSYPILLVHTHETESRREARERERNPVVCGMDGLPVPLERGLPGAASSEIMDAAACAPVPVDAATGRLYAERGSLEDAGNTGVLVFTDSCGGGFVRFGGADGVSSYLVRLPGNDFPIALHGNGTFEVDGRWLAPGTAAKVTYTVAPGDAQDEKEVRAVFDAPGRWLLSRVGPPGDEDPIGRPERGTGLVATVPLQADDLAGVLGPLVAATPGAGAQVQALRVVRQDDRVTEVRADVATDAGVVSWFGAGRVGDQVRVLGAMGPPREDGAGVAPDRLLDAFPEPLGRYAGGAEGTLDLRLAADLAFASPTGAWAETLPEGTAPCEGDCLRVLVDGALGGGWRDAPLAQAVPALDAATLAVRVIDDAGVETSTLWHVPA